MLNQLTICALQVISHCGHVITARSMTVLSFALQSWFLYTIARAAWQSSLDNCLQPSL